MCVYECLLNFFKVQIDCAKDVGIVICGPFDYKIIEVVSYSKYLTQSDENALWYKNFYNPMV